MEVDTGSFRALEARADAVDAIAADVAQIKGHLAGHQLAVTEIYRQGYDDAWMKALGAVRQQHAARHARPRGERPAYLRLVSGGAP